MKKIIVALSKGTLRLVKTIYLFIAFILRALIGNWQPPTWACWITKKTTSTIAKRPRTFASILVLSLIGIFGYQYWQNWWLMHQPKPREIVVVRKIKISVAPPSASHWKDDKMFFDPITLTFSDAAAPLASIGKVVNSGISLTPPLAGTWKWTNEKTLIFQPSTEYQAGTEYVVQLEKSLFPSEVEMDSYQVKVTSAMQLASIIDYKFYTQPDQPDIHQLTATLSTAFPVTQEMLRSSLLFIPLDLDKNTVAPTVPNYTLTASKSPLTWFFRSDAIQIPATSFPMKLMVSKGLSSIVGGKATTQDIVAKAQIPDKYSALSLSNVESMIVKNSQGEPKQMLSVSSSIGVKPNEMVNRIHAWRLRNEDEYAANREYIGPYAVTAEMLARATPVKLDFVPQEDDSPYLGTHTFQFFSPIPGRILVSVDNALPGLGGFELKETYRSFVGVPTFPVELDWTGKGNILALEGERKIQFKSRGVDYIKITLGRVRAGELNHLITQNDYGDFSEPSLDGSFGKDSLVRSQRFVIRVDKKNDWDACYTGFDLSAAIAKIDLSDPDPSRGVFFVEASAVKSIIYTPDQTSVLSRVEESSEYYGDEEYDSYNSIDADDAAVTLLNHDGLPATLQDWFPQMPKTDRHQWSDESLKGSRFVMITDLGVLMKTNADGSRDAFVMSLKSQLPVAGAKVALMARNGALLEEKVTDAMGHAVLGKVKVTAKESQPVVCTVHLAQDMAFIPLRPGQLPALDYSRYSIEGVQSSRTQAVEAQVFTERGVYRPGDEIHYGAVVRRRDWQAVIEGLPIKATLTDSTGAVVSEHNVKLPLDGFFDGRFVTTDSHPTGLYELTLWVMSLNMRDRQFMLGRAALRVEDFRPDRMKMKVALQPAIPKGWIKPTEIKAVVSLENLFGIVAADRRVTGKLELSAAQFSFADWEGYAFNTGLMDQGNSSAGKTIALGEVKTNEKGVAEVVLPLATVDQSTLAVQMSLEAFETDGGHGVRESQSFLVSPWDYVAGFKADGKLDYLGKDSPTNVKFIALSPDAKPVALTGLTYRIIQSKYVSVLRKQDNGNMVYESLNRKVVVRETPGNAWSAEPTNVPIDTSLVGDFTMAVVNEGGETICQCSYSVVGKGDQDRSLDRDAELVVKLSKKEAIAGDSVELSIVAPYAGAGLITLEREKVLYSQWFQSDTTASVQNIQIPADIDGTVYCNVSYVRSLSSPDIMMSPLSYATEPIMITPVKHRMSVTLDAPKLVKPGEVVKVGYRTEEASRIIIYAVDEGIHQITNYKRPQPLDFFFRKQALEVRTQQWFDLLLPEYKFLSQHAAFGGDAEGVDALSLQLNPFKRKRDAPVVWWAGIVTAGNDRRELTWTVPDYFAGSLNIMAVAVNERKIGGAEAKCIVRSPLVLTVNAPVHAAPGDEFVASLTVANNIDKEGAAEVAIALTPSSQLQIIGESTAKLTIEKNREATCRFRVKALGTLGSASLQFIATSGQESSRRTETMSVRPSTQFRSQVRSSYVRTKSNNEKITRDLYDAYRKSEVSVSPLPIVLARGLQNYMEGYPHGCSEQITSKALTLLASHGIKGLDLGLTEAEVNDRLLSAIRLLQSRQSADGGFGYWDSSSSSGAFLTCYVCHYLLEAKESGLPVPQGLLDRSNAVLRKIASGDEPRSLGQADMQAYAIYLLVRKGEKPNGLAALRETLDRVYKDHWQDRVCGSLMASSYALLQKKSDADTIVKHWALAKADAYQNGENYWSYAEVDRLLSFALRARHFPDSVKNYGYADWQKLYGVLWQQRFNTLTASYAAMGMREFSKVATGKKFGYEIFSLPRDQSAPVSLVKSNEIFSKASIDRSVGELQFRIAQSDSDLGLFYQVVEEGYDTTEPEKVVRDGIEVYREITQADGSAVKSMKVGDAVMMKLRVRNLNPNPAPNIAMIDLLPAGFTIEPGALIPGSGTVPGTQRADLREDRNLFYFWLDGAKELSITYQIRATCVGDFVVPALYAESMYDRGINGQGLSSRIKVEPNE
jgi:alpha-2-macroglobulin